MQTILDVKSIAGKIIRFVFTPAGEETLFKSTRDHDIISVINRSQPTNDPYKNHGSLLFGDEPKTVIAILTDEFNRQNRYTEPITVETFQLIKSWIDMHLKKELPEVNIEKLKNRDGLTNTEIACLLLGWQGGTIHQVSEKTGLTVDQILDSKDIETDIKNAM